MSSSWTSAGVLFTLGAKYYRVSHRFVISCEVVLWSGMNVQHSVTAQVPPWEANKLSSEVRFCNIIILTVVISCESMNMPFAVEFARSSTAWERSLIWFKDVMTP